MTITNSSIDTDKSPSGCYGYFKVEDGEITGIGEERTRDGGWFWLNGMPNLEKNIDDLKEWPNLHKLAKRIIKLKTL